MSKQSSDSKKKRQRSRDVVTVCVRVCLRLNPLQEKVQERKLGLWRNMGSLS